MKIGVLQTITSNVGNVLRILHPSNRTKSPIPFCRKSNSPGVVSNRSFYYFFAVTVLFFCKQNCPLPLSQTNSFYCGLPQTDPLCRKTKPPPGFCKSFYCKKKNVLLHCFYPIPFIAKRNRPRGFVNLFIVKRKTFSFTVATQFLLSQNKTARGRTVYC